MLRRMIYIIAHLTFWFVFLLLSVTMSYNSFGSLSLLWEYAWVTVIQIIWAGIIFYLFYFWIADRFLKLNRLYWYLLISVFSSFLLTMVFTTLFLIIYPDLHYMMGESPYLSSTLGTFVIAQVGSMVKGFLNWFDDQQNKAELERRNLQNELTLLKQQINPHFLFNTLNNIDGMIKYDPKGASGAIIKLSEILRYMIYETNQDFIPLEQELDNLKNIIRLHSLRYKQTDFIKLNTCLPAKGIMIPPLIFLPFIENALKHVTDLKKYPAIMIDLSCSEDQLTFKCENHFANGPNNHENSSKGQGISSARRRLELLYPLKHDLKIEQKENRYIVDLTLITK